VIILVRNTKNKYNTEVPELVIPVEGGIREARQQAQALQSNDRKRNFKFHIAQTTNLESAKNYITENQL
jgi:hypothetical protein